MSIPLAEPHVAAVMARLAIDVAAEGGLGEGPKITVDNPKGYAIYPDAGDVENARLCGDRSQITIRFWAHGIGSGPDQAVWMQDRLRESFLGSPVIVTGRRVYRMFQTDASPLMRDDTVEPKLWVQAAEYEMTSQPA